uniref:Uncharacterized protein n=1 Tax=Timema shepardi TaxID=629360 RepID=A0A7R9B3G7_TIMSH|nr:unnamed protein product [Timema shepardi]
MNGPKKPDRPPSKSPLVTTNRTRDSITKPSLVKGDPGEATVKKPVTEAPPKPEEKTSPAPPILGKKPSLPIKKPNRASDPPSKPSNKPVDAVDGASHSRTSHLAPKSNSPSTRVSGIDTREDVAEFDSVERSAMLHHPTASRAKAPRRRPPTFNKDNYDTSHLKTCIFLSMWKWNGGVDTGTLPPATVVVLFVGHVVVCLETSFQIFLCSAGQSLSLMFQEAPTKLMNGSAEERPPRLENHTLPEDGEEGIEEDEGGARGGRSWEREKNKPPWMEELKLNQARKSSSLSPTAKSSPGPLSPTLLSVGSGPTAGERRQPLPTSASRGKMDTTHGMRPPQTQTCTTYPTYSSPVASLVLTDSSQLISDSQHLGPALVRIGLTETESVSGLGGNTKDGSGSTGWRNNLHSTHYKWCNLGLLEHNPGSFQCSLLMELSVFFE